MARLYRAYFNKLSEAPQVWSVDEGNQGSEINVQWIIFKDVTAHSVFDGTVVDRQNVPCAWIEVLGEAEFRDGGVIFHG
jgi:hypothetical protein